MDSDHGFQQTDAASERVSESSQPHGEGVPEREMRRVFLADLAARRSLWVGRRELEGIPPPLFDWLRQSAIRAIARRQDGASDAAPGFTRLRLPLEFFWARRLAPQRTMLGHRSTLTFVARGSAEDVASQSPTEPTPDTAQVPSPTPVLPIGPGERDDSQPTQQLIAPLVAWIHQRLASTLGGTLPSHLSGVLPSHSPRGGASPGRLFWWPDTRARLVPESAAPATSLPLSRTLATLVQTVQLPEPFALLQAETDRQAEATPASEDAPPEPQMPGIPLPRRPRPMRMVRVGAAPPPPPLAPPPPPLRSLERRASSEAPGLLGLVLQMQHAAIAPALRARQLAATSALHTAAFSAEQVDTSRLDRWRVRARTGTLVEPAATPAAETDTAPAAAESEPTATVAEAALLEHQASFEEVHSTSPRAWTPAGVARTAGGPLQFLLGVLRVPFGRGRAAEEAIAAPREGSQDTLEYTDSIASAQTESAPGVGRERPVLRGEEASPRAPGVTSAALSVPTPDRRAPIELMPGPPPTVRPGVVSPSPAGSEQTSPVVSGERTATLPTDWPSLAEPDQPPIASGSTTAPIGSDAHATPRVEPTSRLAPERLALADSAEPQLTAGSSASPVAAAHPTSPREQSPTAAADWLPLDAMDQPPTVSGLSPAPTAASAHSFPRVEQTLTSAILPTPPGATSIVPGQRASTSPAEPSSFPRAAQPLLVTPAATPPVMTAASHRPHEASDAELAQLIASLPAPMAAAALAAGVLRPAAPLPTSPDSIDPVTRTVPGAAERGAGTAPLPMVVSGNPEWHSLGERHSANTSWQSLLTAQHAPTPALGGAVTARSSSGGHAGNGASSSSAAPAVVARAPLDREHNDTPPGVAPLAATGPDSANATGSAPPQTGEDLDRLAEDVYARLRWRLAAERERHMGQF